MGGESDQVEGVRKDGSDALENKAHLDAQVSIFIFPVINTRNGYFYMTQKPFICKIPGIIDSFLCVSCFFS